MSFNKNTDNIILILLTITVIIQLGIIIFVFEFEREGYHSDESWSYGFANSFFDSSIYLDEKGELENFNSWVSSQSLRNYLVVNTGESFRLDSVYYNQKSDLSPPLHSMILHIICSFFPEKFSRWYAFSINIFSFIFTQIFIYLLGINLTNSRWFGLILVQFYGFTTGALNCFVYLRMYALLTLLAVIFTYLHTRLIKMNFNNIKNELFVLYLCTFLGVITHYYFYIFSFTTAIFYCSYLGIKKLWIKLLKYASCLLVAVLSPFIIFPYLLTNLINGSSAYARQMPFEWSLKYCNSILVNEITGISVGFPKLADFATLLIILSIIAILVFALMFLFRHDQWFRKMLDETQKSIRIIFYRIYSFSKEIHLQIWAMTFTILSVVSAIAKFSNVLLMNILTDRYLFFIMPITCTVIAYISYSLIRSFNMNYIYLHIILFVMMFMLVMNNNLQTDCNYLFKRNSQGPRIEEMTANSDCIILTKESWYLTYYANLLINTNKYYITTGTDISQSYVQIEKEDITRPAYLIIEKRLFQTLEDRLSALGVSIHIDESNSVSEFNTLDEYIAYLDALPGVKSITYVSTESGFSGDIAIYRIT